MSEAVSRLQSESVPRFLSGEARVLPGIRREIVVPSPAAGADWSLTVPAGVQWRPLMLRSLFATSAVVANRNVRIQISTADLTLLTIPSNQSFVASVSTIVAAFVGAGAQYVSNTALTVTLPLPDVWLLAGYRIGSSTLAVDVGDQYSGIVLTVDEFQASNELLTEAYFEHCRERAARAGLDVAAELHAVGVSVETLAERY